MKWCALLTALLAGLASLADLPAQPPVKEVNLSDLSGLCKKMLEVQRAVHKGTSALRQAIAGTPDKKPSPEHQRLALQLSISTKVSAKIATRAIQMLEAEGAGVAFPEVMRQLREDLVSVRRRLESGDVGKITQTIEEDVIDTLKEMVTALKPRQPKLERRD